MAINDTLRVSNFIWAILQLWLGIWLAYPGQSVGRLEQVLAQLPRQRQLWVQFQLPPPHQTPATFEQEQEAKVSQGAKNKVIRETSKTYLFLAQFRIASCTVLFSVILSPLVDLSFLIVALFNSVDCWFELCGCLANSFCPLLFHGHHASQSGLLTLACSLLAIYIGSRQDQS